MAAITTQTTSSSSLSIKSILNRHPLPGFFIAAYAGIWVALLPPLLAQNGVGLLPIKLPLFPFLALATFLGPSLAAVVTVWSVDGKEGITNLFRRYTMRPRRYWWFVLALFGPLEALLLASSLSLGSAPFDAIRQQPFTFAWAYLGALVVGSVVGPVGEELGWRGFALPRLQKQLGPLWGSLILGVVWVGWHLPLFFLPEWRGNTDPLTIGVLFASWVLPFTFIMTWVYNSARGSLLVATLLHAAENASVAMIPAGLLLIPNDVFLQAKVYGVAAILLIVVTRGKLSVDSFREPSDAQSRQAGAGDRKPLTRTRIAVFAVAGLIALYVIVNIAYDIVNGAR